MSARRGNVPVRDLGAGRPEPALRESEGELPLDPPELRAARPGLARRVLRRLELPVLLATPLALGVCAVWQVNQTAILTLAIAVCSVATLFAGFEASRPAIRQVMPSVVLGAVAATGRILFAPIPDVKPVSAIVVMAGGIFGRQHGFMVGALAALVSNLFFGQGPWTPWQMYSWGLVGYVAGILGEYGLLERKPVLYGYGFFAGILYGTVMDSWNVIGFVHPLTLPSVLLAYGAGLPHNVVHGLATVAFLVLIYAPWSRKLARIKRKYDLRSASERAVAARRRARAAAVEGTERERAL